MTWLLLPAGVAIAIVAVFFGLGGGVIWVPLLIGLYGLEPREAVLCALVIQVFGQAGGTLASLRQGLVDRGLLVQQMLWAAPACLAGAAASAHAAAFHIELGLGLLTFAIVYLFLRGDSLFAAGGAVADLEASRRLRPVSAFGGVLTGFVSVGVGDLVIPMFNRVSRLEMARAVATGVALMLVMSSLAVLGHLGFGGVVPWRLVAFAAPGVMIGGWLGGHLIHRVSENRLKELFVLFLVFLAAHVTFNAL